MRFNTRFNTHTNPEMIEKKITTQVKGGEGEAFENQKALTLLKATNHLQLTTQ